MDYISTAFKSRIKTTEFKKVLFEVGGRFFLINGVEHIYGYLFSAKK